MKTVRTRLLIVLRRWDGAKEATRRQGARCE
jgi:hypothetical protein